MATLYMLSKLSFFLRLDAPQYKWKSIRLRYRGTGTFCHATINFDLDIFNLNDHCHLALFY